MSCQRGSYNFSKSQNNSACSQPDRMNNTKNNSAGPGADVRNMQTRQPSQEAITSDMPIAFQKSPMPTTVESQYYTAGFLKQFLGRNMRVEFLIGTTGALVDRVGVLIEVGASYIVLQPYLTDDLLMCDLYSIKFVNIYGPGGSIV